MTTSHNLHYTIILATDALFDRAALVDRCQAAKLKARIDDNSGSRASIRSNSNLAHADGVSGLPTPPIWPRLSLIGRIATPNAGVEFKSYARFWTRR